MTHYLIKKKHLNKIIEHIEKRNSYIQPYPTNVVASLWVFVSHLGRAAVYQSIEDFSAAENELIKSKDHLDRAIMDSNKNLIMFLSGKITKHIFRSHMPVNYWNDMIKIRKMEHDREDLTSRVTQFNLLLHPIQNFATWLKHNSGGN